MTSIAAVRARMQQHIDLATDEERERERQRESDSQFLLRTRLLVAIKDVCLELTYTRCAAELELLWGPHGLHVTAAQLRACLEGVERNYFRLEWAIWFSQQSEEVAHLVREMGGAGLPKKTPQQELEDLKRTLAEEFPKQAGKLIRKAETR